MGRYADCVTRFWTHVKKQPGCWERPVSIATNGYSQLRVGSRLVMAHRFSWEIHFGPIPTGMKILHKCDNRLCVKPSHLFLGTQADNVQDMMSKGRHVSNHGELNGSAKLTRERVEQIRNLYSSGKSQVQLAKLFQVHQAHISKIVLRKIWK